MQVKLLKDVVSSIAGSGVAGIVDLLYGKKNVNEFLIAKKLKLTINQARNTLYKLADAGIVSFIRKKDTKKGGWYTYFWTLNTGKSLLKFKEHLASELSRFITQKTVKKQGRFFFCTNCQLEFSEEAALLNHYTCPECGDVLTLKDSGPEVVSLDKEITRVRTIFDSVNKELEIIAHQEEKSRARKVKAESERRAKERVLKRKEREKELVRARKHAAKGKKRVKRAGIKARKR